MADSDNPPAPVLLYQRTLPGQLRYLAQQLLAGTEPRIVAAVLEIIADQQERETGND